MYNKVKKLMLECFSNLLSIRIWNRIKKNCLEVIKDPFGNYIIQLVLKLKFDEESVYIIANVILKNIENLCVHKIASNVVESCIESVNEVRNFNKFI